MLASCCSKSSSIRSVNCSSGYSRLQDLQCIFACRQYFWMASVPPHALQCAISFDIIFCPGFKCALSPHKYVLQFDNKGLFCQGLRVRVACYGLRVYNEKRWLATILWLWHRFLINRRRTQIFADILILVGRHSRTKTSLASVKSCLYQKKTPQYQNLHHSQHFLEIH